jgi:hypothetical protein
MKLCIVDHGVGEQGVFVRVLGFPLFCEFSPFIAAPNLVVTLCRVRDGANYE